MEKEKYNILVIDDEEPIRRFLLKELATDQREVLVAADGGEAMKMVKSHWFDVIVMDLRLPDSHDLDLLIEIKESVPHIEVVMIIGHGGIDVAVKAMKLGACDFHPQTVQPGSGSRKSPSAGAVVPREHHTSPQQRT